MLSEAREAQARDDTVKGRRRHRRERPKDGIHAQVAELRHQAGREWTRLEAFYLSDQQRARLLAKPWVLRWPYRWWWLLASLLSKLVPHRRLMLAIALIILVTNLPRAHVEVFGGAMGFPRPGALFGSMLLVVVLMLELKDKLVARDELEAGRRVQLALMPEGNPNIPGWDVWLYSMPANDVGGDLVDHQQIDGRRHAVVLGDVAGKALPAALLMVKLQATLRALTPQFEYLGDLGSAVNKILVRDGLSNRFATLVLLVLTEDLGGISVLNAGHMPPFVIRGRDVEAMAPGSTVLGLIADATFAEQRIELKDQDVLLVYSDGVPDAMNESGESFGDDRPRTAIVETLGQPVEEIGTRIRQTLEAFVGEAPRHDDVSLVVVKRREQRIPTKTASSQVPA
jgi:hypothetical protein